MCAGLYGHPVFLENNATLVYERLINVFVSQHFETIRAVSA